MNVSKFLEDIKLISKDKEDNKELSVLKQKRLYMSLEIEGKALLLFINDMTGRIDFIVEPPNLTIEGHKNRLLVSDLF